MGGKNLFLKQIEVGPMQNFAYLVGDYKTSECMVVDPAWDVDGLLEICDKGGMKVIGGLLTHTHFDHVNGVNDLLSKIDGPVYVHKKEVSFLKTDAKKIQKVDEGYQLKLGEMNISFLHTPGHSPGSLCFLVEDYLISGDTLFVGACGRCDLPGGNPEEMYRSLRRLAQLDDKIKVLPGHHYGEQPSSTIGLEMKQNPYLQYHSLNDFLAVRMGY